MNFRVAARVISHLGAELISSDEIAIYELVKNGFDAKSPQVEVSVRFRVSTSILQRLQLVALELAEVAGLQSTCPADILKQILSDLKRARTEKREHEFFILSDEELTTLAGNLREGMTIAQVVQTLGKVNTIDVVDSGSGMTPEEVGDYYLTIGTTHRLREVEAIELTGEAADVPAGEKGIGRLSAMRLGNELEMFTVKRTGQLAVLVGINWREFLFRRDDELSAIPVTFDVQNRGDAASGTLISISDLTSDWQRDKAVRLGTDHLAKFIDPFPKKFVEPESEPSSRIILLKWNGETLDTREFISRFLDAAQNTAIFRLSFEEGSAYLESIFTLGETKTRSAVEQRRRYTIADFSGFTDEQLSQVGPFEVYLYHFPRNRLKAIPQFASRMEVKKWLDRWCGGIMLFRDGIRVLPYGAEGDDWLHLDSAALRGRGFRVNRIQVVGCVRISRIRNPQLIDQTNREGLRDNEAYNTFQSIIQRHIQENFVSALQSHLSDERGDLDQLSNAVSREYNLLTDCVEEIENASREKNWQVIPSAVAKLRTVLADFGEINDSVEKALAEKEINRVQVLELAATGMAAEAMAHDLEGVVETAIASLSETVLQGASERISAAVRHIRSVHKALLTQIKQLTPGPARARRRAATFNLMELVADAGMFYIERCKRHSIALNLPSEAQAVLVHAVPGHVRQVLDNLFRNSIFWLQETKRKFRDWERLEINVSIDAAAKLLSFADTGIGIAPEEADWVFEPFNTHRKEGRGLGLYICRELCAFNNIQFLLNRSPTNRFGRLSTFTLTFP